MDDLISRQAAIDAMCELMHHWFWGIPKDEIREIKRELEKLPSAQPEPQWISVTERLPDKECFVLVTVNDGSIYTDLSLFRHDGRFIEHTGDVIAWLPLPEPYKEKDNERA